MRITLSTTIGGEKHTSSHEVPTPMRDGATPDAKIDAARVVNILNQAWSGALNMALQSSQPIEAISLKVKYR
jgi:hypothetical protein